MVFFGGAGVSTESGIPDFRSPDGLYAQKYPHPPEQMISRSFFDAHPAEFFAFYCDRMLALDAEPNRAHRKLAELRRQAGTLVGRGHAEHRRAAPEGRQRARAASCTAACCGNFCMGCGKAYPVERAAAACAHEAADGVPRCPACGGIVKPDVVLYEEPLDERTLSRRPSTAIGHADLLVVAGTSLAVYPAAGLIDFFAGSHLVIVNHTPTPRDQHADLCLAANVGDVFDF